MSKRGNKMNFIEETVDILDLLYKHNWDERNGGNLSYIIKEEEVKSFLKEKKLLEHIIMILICLLLLENIF